MCMCLGTSIIFLGLDENVVMLHYEIWKINTKGMKIDNKEKVDNGGERIKYYGTTKTYSAEVKFNL